MKLEISDNRTIREVQNDFNNQFPFLKLEFYKMEGRLPSVNPRVHLPHSVSLKAAGLKTNGYIEISNEVTVGELEKSFSDRFGLLAQVSRNSGGVWLETTMTDNWSLQKQNDHGKEIIKHTSIKRNFTDLNGEA